MTVEQLIHDLEQRAAEYQTLVARIAKVRLELKELDETVVEIADELMITLADLRTFQRQRHDMELQVDTADYWKTSDSENPDA